MNRKIETTENGVVSPRKYVVIFLGTGAFIVITLLLTPLVIRWCIGSHPSDLSERGQFSDQFGIANALFSGLAFAALVVTLFMQRAELELQRQELSDSRKVMEEQRDEFQKQVAALRKQNFEATFFQMLRLQQELREAIEIQFVDGTMLRGRQATAKLATRMRKVLVGGQPQMLSDYFGLPASQAAVEYMKPLWGDGSGDATDRESVLQRYEFISREIIDEPMGHYFRNLYVLLKLIDESDLTDPERRQYLRIYRAQLSQSEWTLIFYNANSEYGKAKMMPLLEKYGIFQNYRTAFLAHPSHKEWVKSPFARDPGVKQV